MTTASTDAAPAAYELTLRFNEQARTEVALNALFEHPTLDGPYVDLEPAERVAPAELFSREHDGGYAYASVDEGEPLLCTVRYELWPDAPAKVLKISLEVEAAVHRLGVIDEWMAGLGRWVFRAVPFEVGVVGDSFLSDWTGEAFWPQQPLRRSYGLLWPEVNGDRLDVAWHAPIRE